MWHVRLRGANNKRPLSWGGGREHRRKKIHHKYTETTISQPGPNSKSISVLGQSKSKSHLVSQYWASLNASLTSLASLNQDFLALPCEYQEATRLQYLNTEHDTPLSKISEQVTVAPYENLD